VRDKSLISIVILVALLGAACGGDEDDAASGASAVLTDGRDVYRDSCAVCHGNGGEGGVGAALADVTATFPDCEEHVRWIAIGSSKWQNDVGPTYGAQEREVAGSMPGFDGVRTDAEIRLAAAYQRVAFGGETEAEAIAACGVTG